MQHIQNSARLVQSAYERPAQTDGRKTRLDIFHPVYRVGILFTTSLFARVSGSIVISGRLIRSVRGRNKRTKNSARGKHIHFRAEKSGEWGWRRTIEISVRGREEGRNRGRENRPSYRHFASGNDSPKFHLPHASMLFFASEVPRTSKFLSLGFYD